MQETRLFYGLEKALPGENNELFSKEFSRKMQLFFFPFCEEKGALKKPQKHVTSSSFSLILLTRIESVAASRRTCSMLTVGAWRIWTFQSTPLRPSKTNYSKVSQQDFAALADADSGKLDAGADVCDFNYLGNSFLNVMMSPRSMIVSCCCCFFVWLHRDGLRVWFAQRLLFIDIVSTCDSNLKTSENKRKLSTELTHCPFLKTPKKNHPVASCCAATIKEILFTRDFENKEPHARWEICSAAQRQSSCPKSSGLG